MRKKIDRQKYLNKPNNNKNLNIKDENELDYDMDLIKKI